MRDPNRADRESEEKFKLSTGAFWLGAILAVYLFSSGPVTRWFPVIADKIYAPLSPLMSSETFSKPLRGWLSLWGVDTGSGVQ